MLQLTDPQWRELQGLYGSSEDVPRLLARLQEEYVTQVRDKLYWEHLYHQNTLYSCTYAAVPYLAELAWNASNPATKLDIYIQCGIFEANNGNDLECEIPAEFTSDQIQVAPEPAKAIYRSYQKALTSLPGMTESLADFRGCPACLVIFHQKRTSTPALQRFSRSFSLAFRLFRTMRTLWYRPLF